MSEENFTYSEWPFFSCSRVRRTFASEPYFEISSGRRPREISKGSQANVLLTSEQEKKEVTIVCGWNFFTKIETIILTDCFFKFSAYFRVIEQRKTKKCQKMIFFFTTVKKNFTSLLWRKILLHCSGEKNQIDSKRF